MKAPGRDHMPYVKAEFGDERPSDRRWTPSDNPQPEHPAPRTPNQAPAGYVELHCHSCYSLREGASSPLELVLQALELGYDALAVTDHDGLYGAMEYAQTARSW